jgi:hypothetical protein
MLAAMAVVAAARMRKRLHFILTGGVCSFGARTGEDCEGTIPLFRSTVFLGVIVTMRSR